MASSHVAGSNLPLRLITGVVSLLALPTKSIANLPLTQRFPSFGIQPTWLVTRTIWFLLTFRSIWQPTPQYGQVVLVRARSLHWPLPLARRSYSAPVGHVEMHCPHSPHVDSFKGISKAVVTSTAEALSLNVSALSICTSSQILMHLPHRMHLSGSYSIASWPAD